MLQNLKVGQKILLSFLVVLLLLIVLLVSNLSGIKTVNNYAAIRREGKTAYIHLLLTRHKVLTLIYNTSLTNEARLKALEEQHKHVEDFHETIKLIKSIAKESDLLAHVDALDKHFTRYDELADKAGEAAIRAGLDFSSGILLQINQTGRAAEKSVVQRDDLELILMDARRYEKKFLVTNHDEDAVKFRDRMNKYVKALQAEGFPEDTITKANEYSKTFEDLYTAKREVDKAIAEAVQIGNNDMKQELDAVFEIIDGTKDKLGLVKKAFNRIYATSFTITGIAIILSIVIGLLLTSNLVPPIVSLQKNVLIVADGDYSRVIPHAKSKDEIGDLTEAVIKMKWVTRELLEKVNNSSTHVASASQELSATADETGKGVQMVAAVIQEVANGAQDIAKNLEVANQNLRQTSMAVEEVTKDIEQVSHFSEESRQDAIKGSEQAIYAVEQINNVKHTVEQTSSVIQSLGEKSAQIGEIVGLITGIASQTNLLALNAAIEAARAGEAGRGFAVVADEVRKLAEESSSAAQNIRHLIDEITAEMDKALNAMTTTTQEVDRGADLVSETGSALVEIVSSIEKIAQQVEGVSAAAEEMNASIHEVMEAMHHITTDAERAAAGAEEASSATQEQTAAVEEVDASAHSLAKLAEELQTTVHKFKL